MLTGVSQMSRYWSIVFLLFAYGPFSQTQTQPAVLSASPTAAITADQLVDRLISNIELYHATLPSLEAHESIVSRFDEGATFGRRGYAAEATVRIQRQPGSDLLKESRQITSLNGKRIPPDQNVHLPLNFVNDFDDLLSEFFSTQYRVCYIFNLSPHANPKTAFKLQVRSRPDAATLSHCARAVDGLTALVRVDPDALQIIHMESTVPDAIAAPRHRPTFFSADYAPVAFGNRTLWLPIAITAHFLSGNSDRAVWVSHYTNYHQYIATSTILPGDSQ